MENLKETQKKLLAALRKADYDFGLIENGDRIMVGISGGKDSLALLKLLSLYQKFKAKEFTIVACHIDFGFPSVDFSPVERFCTDLGVQYINYPSQEVYDILKQHRNAKGLLPCSICSRMRKAVINKCANELGFTKVAFAHHMDDAIITLFMNMSYGARVNTFEPKMHLEKAGIDFIRPLIYARENLISHYAELLELPITKNLCGNDKTTQREFFKKWLGDFFVDHPDAYSNFSVMLTNYQCFQLWFDRIGINPGNGLFIKEAVTKDDILDVAALAKSCQVINEEFSPSDSYFLIRKDKKPLGYISVHLSQDREEAWIKSLAFIPECQKNEQLIFLDSFEKSLATNHLPLTITTDLQNFSELFLQAGYTLQNEVFRKTLVKSDRF
ncbi:MAG: ATP-binding protein [Bacilli bacterium]